ncbi:hypothetical protein [Agrobacterium tumefaciens]|uniref:Uncharacterized protein n=1 Tax=Agrobacterium tumefaciens TaxID=358 RepID=A0AA44F6I7_AGRTU|nr:hypothetical protein [Agrobacterium tumefaciens]NTB87570.1 hypothetical protein [Agrobacterium tumefaciens]NTC19735.1 hypothetical protein [Agrobacterium tumefaciens]NTC29663.1 hypothetical protein [Agrobacterium tumefaciens]
MNSKTVLEKTASFAGGSWQISVLNMSARPDRRSAADVASPLLQHRKYLTQTETLIGIFTQTAAVHAPHPVTDSILALMEQVQRTSAAMFAYSSEIEPRKK